MFSASRQLTASTSGINSQFPARSDDLIASAKARRPTTQVRYLNVGVETLQCQHLVVGAAWLDCILDPGDKRRPVFRQKR